jgi:hypothetical protein
MAVQQSKVLDFWASIPVGEGQIRRKELQRSMERLVVRPLSEELKRARQRAAKARFFPVE